MSNQPWMKFYPSDWRSDPALRMCSLAARGLWVEMLAIMHEANPRGQLMVKGVEITVQNLAMLVGSSADEVEKLVNELEQYQVFSRKKNGVIFSRRIEKDENQARKNRENGKMGGNPSLCKTTEKTKSVKGGDKAQKPEARSQKPDKEKYKKEFEEFYSLYPNKKAKPKAFDAFVKAMGKASFDEIMAGLRRYIANKPPQIDFAHPATWLNQERWNDEYTTNLGQSQQSGNRGGGSFVDAAARFQARRQNSA